MENYETLNSVFGYENIKKELMLIRSWFMDDELLKNESVKLPRGIVWYGAPGCGKTLMMREYSKSFDCPVHVIEGKGENISDEIRETFEKARNESKAIIVIDEIDLLVNKDDKLERTLQQELDGMKDNGRILVLAATNSSVITRSPLFRNGRFDRKIFIGCPDYASRVELFTKFISEFGVDTKGIDMDYLAQISGGSSGSDIRSVVNDAYLRCRENMTSEEIEESYSRIELKTWADDPIKSKNYRVAIHEAGHAVMSMRYPEIFSFHLARFTEGGGFVKYYDVEEKTADYEYQVANLSVSIGGYLAEELFFKKRGIGSTSDMSRARSIATNLINHSGILDINDTIDCWSDADDRVESELKRMRLERKAARMLRKAEKDVKRYLKANKNTIKSLADIMMEKGSFTIKDVNALNSK